MNPQQRIPNIETNTNGSEFENNENGNNEIYKERIIRNLPVIDFKI